MANTPVLFQAPSGLASVTLELYPRNSDSIANGGGGDSAAEETNAKTWYRAMVDHGISGWHRSTIKEAGTPIGGDWIDMVDDAEVHSPEYSGHSPMPELTGITDAPAAPWFKQAIMLLYMWLRNNSQDTSTERRILDDAGTEILDATMSDDDTTFQQGKFTDA